MTSRLLIGKITLSISYVCAPQCGRPCEEKDDFYLVQLSSISTVSPDDVLIVWEDLNIHLGKDSDGFKGIHDGYGYGIKNTDGTRVLNMCVATNLVVANSFKKDINELMPFSSGSTKTQIDYILSGHIKIKHTENIQVICGEEFAFQHRRLVRDFKLCTKLKSAKSHIPKRRIRKLKRPNVRLEFNWCV